MSNVILYEKSQVCVQFPATGFVSGRWVAKLIETIRKENARKCVLLRRGILRRSQKVVSKNNFYGFEKPTLDSSRVESGFTDLKEALYSTFKECWIYSLRRSFGFQAYIYRTFRLTQDLFSAKIYSSCFWCKGRKIRTLLNFSWCNIMMGWKMKSYKWRRTKTSWSAFVFSDIYPLESRGLKFSRRLWFSFCRRHQRTSTHCLLQWRSGWRKPF